MNIEPGTEIARKWKGAGEALNLSPDNTRLLIRAWRTLAKGRPVSGEQIGQNVSDPGGQPGRGGRVFERRDGARLQ